MSASSETTSEALFAGYEPPPAPEPMSADRRRTHRQAADVAAGRHPLTGGPLHPLASRHRDAAAPKDDPFTCGSCYYRDTVGHHDKTYPKCLLPAPVGADQPMRKIYTRVTAGPASDVRAWWPACRDYVPGAGGLSPDAARCIPEPTA